MTAAALVSCCDVGEILPARALSAVIVLELIMSILDFVTFTVCRALLHASSALPRLSVKVTRDCLFEYFYCCNLVN